MIVVGAGAIGNELIKNLVLIGIGKIHIIDFDEIEIHNLTRSVLFNESHIGYNKAEIAAEVAQKLNNDCKISFSKEDFWKSLSLFNVKEADAIFCCVDNYEARIKLNKLCHLIGTDFYNAGIDSRYISVEVYPFSRDINTPCLECNLTPAVYKRISERYSCGWLQKIAFTERKIPTTIITSTIAASSMLSLYLQSNHPQGYNNSVKMFTDSISLISTVSQQNKNENCSHCSNYKDKIFLFKAKNGSMDSFPVEYSLDLDFLIELSDPIILDVRCVKCGQTKTINDKTSNYDESITICESCRLHSNDVEIVDVLSFKTIHERFSEKIPVKFITFKSNNNSFIIELEQKNG